MGIGTLKKPLRGSAGVFYYSEFFQETISKVELIFTS